MKYKVAQIIPYFGKWPEWIELYFYSCGRNPMVDFIFYTDCPLPKHKYKNTIFYQCSFSEYKRMVSERLGCNYNPAETYKLTDLKPFLGYVHKQELKEYDFWGFGDLDLVYGDLSMLVNDDILSKNEVITSHSYRVAGHFTICRNNNYYQQLCLKIKNWQNGLSSEQHFGYDEMDWSRLINPFERNIGRICKYISSPLGISNYKVFDFFNKLLLPHKFLKECFTTPNPSPQSGKYPSWTYNLKNNIILNSEGRSIPYLHFMCFKKNRWMVSDFYWKEGYVQLDDDIENYNEILFDYKGITGKDDKK